MIKSYRGILVDGEQQHIRLGTPQGKVGYRILKLDIMSSAPGVTNSESLVQIFKTEQTTVPTSGATVDFSDSALLAAAFWKESADYYHPLGNAVVFDQEIFNQDIFITHTNQEGTLAVNYYLELEQVKLNEQEALVSIVKNLRLKQ